MSTIKSVLVEDRQFPPSPEFKSRAILSSMEEYESLYRKSITDPEAFFGARARELLPWMKPFDRVLEWNEPFAKWFLGGKTNVSFACLDRHVSGGRRNKAAL